MSIQTVGVIGAGQMGNGIAHTFAVAGYRVLLNDISEDALTAAMARIEKNTARQVSKGTLGKDARAEALANIRTTQDLGELGGTDLVIEAATEREDVKNQIFAGLASSLGKTRSSPQTRPLCRSRVWRPRPTVRNASWGFTS